MAKIGLIRCERNAVSCPMTGCLTCIQKTRQGFQEYGQAELVGMFTCSCPGDRDHLVHYAKTLQKKGAAAIHLVTGAFAHKENGQWVMGNACAPGRTTSYKS